MNENTNPFAGLEDESLWTKEHLPPREETVTLFVEDCPKCRGTGTYHGRSRHGHKCFKCKGKGKLEFKTSAAQRQRGRKSAAKAKQKKAEINAAAYLEWLNTEPDVRDWIIAAIAAGNDWAANMNQGGMKYGSLTENMVTAIRKAIARDDESREGFKAWCANHEGVLEWLTSETEKGNEFAGDLLAKGQRWGTLTDGQLNAVIKNIDDGKATEDAGSELDLSDLVKGYYAVPDGDTRLKVAIRRPGKNSRWYGWTFVDDGAAYGSRKTYGKQAPDGTYAGSIQDQLRAIIENPLEAMVAYGKLTGTCGKCGRILEDEESVAAGIGPICATKM
jgi:hypothetical protein